MGRGKACQSLLAHTRGASLSLSSNARGSQLPRRCVTAPGGGGGVGGRAGPVLRAVASGAVGQGAGQAPQPNACSRAAALAATATAAAAGACAYDDIDYDLGGGSGGGGGMVLVSGLAAWGSMQHMARGRVGRGCELQYTCLPACISLPSLGEPSALAPSDIDLHTHISEPRACPLSTCWTSARYWEHVGAPLLVLTWNALECTQGNSCGDPGRPLRKVG